MGENFSLQQILQAYDSRLCDDSSIRLCNIIHFYVLTQTEIKLSLSKVLLHHLVVILKLSVWRATLYVCVFWHLVSAMELKPKCYNETGCIARNFRMTLRSFVLVYKRCVGTVESFVIDHYYACSLRLIRCPFVSILEYWWLQSVNLGPEMYIYIYVCIYIFVSVFRISEPQYSLERSRISRSTQSCD